MMYKFPHHNHVITLLGRFRRDFLSGISACFGGGTLLTLLYGEYRCSKDIDFICPVGDGYRSLRSEIFEKQYNALFTCTEGISLPRDIKADQYGVRFVAGIDDTWIKCEIIAESRITLEPPAFHAGIPVPCLSLNDSFTEKLLANADRWGDRSVESRDLIDLSVLRLQSPIPKSSIDKAETAYPVIKPLEKSIRMFQEDHTYRASCFSSLQIAEKEPIIHGIDLLASDFGLTPLKYKDDL